MPSVLGQEVSEQTKRREGERWTERDRDRERQRERRREIERQGEGGRETDRERHTDRDTDRRSALSQLTQEHRNANYRLTQKRGEKTREKKKGGGGCSFKAGAIEE